MQRRDFMCIAVGAAAVYGLPAHAQAPTKRPLIAILSGVTREDNRPLQIFVGGLQQLGYVEGKNIDIVYRFANGRLIFPTSQGKAAHGRHA